MPIRIEELVLKTVVLDRDVSRENNAPPATHPANLASSVHQEVADCLRAAIENERRRAQER